MFPRVLSFLALCFLTLTPSARAEDIRRVTLDGQKSRVAPTEDATRGGNASISHVPTPELEIFPTADPGSHGTVLIASGGGYRLLAIDHEGRKVARMLNEAGWDAAVLLYHVNEPGNVRALALEDAQKAYALLQTSGKELGLSTTRLGVMGFSAGGHLMARLAHELAAAGHAPAFIVLMYPAYLETNGVLLDDVSPANAPTFLRVGDRDYTYLPSAEAYAAACKAKDIPCDYAVVPGAGHGFGLTDHLPAGARDLPEKLKAFLAAPGR